MNSPSSSAGTGGAFPASGCVTETETVRMAVMNSAVVSDSGEGFSLVKVQWIIERLNSPLQRDVPVLT